MGGRNFQVIEANFSVLRQLSQRGGTRERTRGARGGVYSSENGESSCRMKGSESAVVVCVWHGHNYEIKLTG
jgi:hypothetical protein